MVAVKLVEILTVIIFVSFVVPSNGFYSSYCDGDSCDRVQRIDNRDDFEWRRSLRESRLSDTRQGKPDDAQNKYIRDKGRIEFSARRENVEGFRKTEQGTRLENERNIHLDSRIARLDSRRVDGERRIDEERRERAEARLKGVGLRKNSNP